MKTEQITLDTRIGSRTVSSAFAEGLNDRQITARLQMEGASDEHDAIAKHVASLRNWYEYEGNESETQEVRRNLLSEAA